LQIKKRYSTSLIAQHFWADQIIKSCLEKTNQWLNQINDSKGYFIYQIRTELRTLAVKVYQWNCMLHNMVQFDKLSEIYENNYWLHQWVMHLITDSR